MAKKEKKILKHPFYDRHTILGAIALALLALVISQVVVGSIITGIFTVITGIKDPKDSTYIIVQSLSTVLGSFVALAFFRRWFYPEYEGGLKGGQRVSFWTLIGLGLVVIVFILSLITGIGELGIPSIAAISTALMAGIGEETIFRGFCASYLMRQWVDQKKILPAIIVSSVLFGLIHIFNVFTGAPLLMTIGQVFTSFMMGCFLCTLYVRSGNLIPSMVMHFVYDVVAFMDVKNISEGGTFKETATTSVADKVIQYLVSALFIILTLYLTRPAVRDEICEMWRKKWGKKAV